VVYKKLQHASLMWVLWLSTELVINLPRYCWLLLKSYLDCLESRAEEKYEEKSDPNNCRSIVGIM